jgi:hypothetical protein
MSQRGFWDEQERISKLQAKKPILKVLAQKVPWETFSPLLEQAYDSERKSPAGRKRINPLMLFKMLILQQLFNLSDSELEFQVNDRRSFEEFIGLGIMDTIPDATTVAFFRKHLRKAGLIEEAGVPSSGVIPPAPPPRRSRGGGAHLRRSAPRLVLQGVGRPVSLVRVLPQPDRPCPELILPHRSWPRYSMAAAPAN